MHPLWQEGRNSWISQSLYRSVGLHEAFSGADDYVRFFWTMLYSKTSFLGEFQWCSLSSHSFGSYVEVHFSGRSNARLLSKVYLEVTLRCCHSFSWAITATYHPSTENWHVCKIWTFFPPQGLGGQCLKPSHADPVLQAACEWMC